MFSEDRRHSVAADALELTRAVGAELRMTPYAVAELEAQIREANRFINRYKGEPRLLDYADDVIVRSFRAAQHETPGLSWSGYIAQFDPPLAWLEAHGVAIDPDMTADLEGDHRLELFEAAVRARRPTAASVTVRTDALNLLHVLRNRSGAQADAMGSRVWLITTDGSLEDVERDLAVKELVDGPVSRLVGVWARLLGPCLPPETAGLAEYLTRLIRTEFGLLAEDPTFIDTDFLSVLGDSRFQVADVLTDEKIARQVLARLQTDDELRQLLKTAEPDTDEWNGQLAEAVRRSLEELDVSTVDPAELDAARTAQARAEHAAEVERKSRLDLLRQNAELKRDLQLSAERAEAAESALDGESRKTWLQKLLGI